MTDDLNIRAARCLRWELSDYHKTDNFFLIPEKQGLYLGNLLGKTTRLLNAYPKEMYFTTSYDWSMLGVKECHRLQKMQPWVNYFVKFLALEGELATPSQITEAWVAVLEENEG